VLDVADCCGIRADVPGVIGSPGEKFGAKKAFDGRFAAYYR
jgi:hypothetical protein